MNVKRFAVAAIGLLLMYQANAEYCWMVGCKGREGYVMTYFTKGTKKESIFKGRDFPTVGTEAVIVTFVRMSDSPPSNTEEGAYRLGPGFIVRVLGYMGEGNQIAHIKVISDDLK